MKKEKKHKLLNNTIMYEHLYVVNCIPRKLNKSKLNSIATK